MKDIPSFCNFNNFVPISPKPANIGIEGKLMRRIRDHNIMQDTSMSKISKMRGCSTMMYR